MTKEEWAWDNFFKLVVYLNRNHAPECIQEELEGFALRFKKIGWPSYQKYSNGAYAGQIRSGERHGIGIYVWDSGDMYIGEYCNGNKQGYGFYYFPNGQIYWGQWENDNRHGHGHVWEPNYESEGTYVNDKEVNNMYVRSNGSFRRNVSTDSSSSGCGWLIVLIFVIVILFAIVF